MISRKRIALLAEGIAHRGEPSPCFCPDFSADSAYYKELGTLNEVSVAQSKHSLSDIAAFHLKEIPQHNMPVVDDDTSFDNIVPKSWTESQLTEYARSLEHEILSQKKDD